MKYVRERKTNTVWFHIFVESKKAKLIETEKTDCCQGLEGGENEGMLDKEYKPFIFKWISSGDLMYSLVTVVNITVLCTWKLLREWILNVLTTTVTKTKKVAITWGKVYIN